MATGSVRIWTIEANTIEVGNGSTATLATIAVPTDTTITITPKVLYQRTNNADNGFAERTCVANRGTSATVAIKSTGGGASASWGQTAFSFVATGSNVLVRVNANTGDTRYAGTIDVMDVEQHVSAASFDLDDVGGLEGWYRLDTGVTTVSGAVSQISDQSGNSRHLTQTTTSARPTYSSTGLNSNPTMTGDTTSMHMSADAVASTVSGDDHPYSVYVVMALPTGGSADYLYGFGHSTGSGNFEVLHKSAAPYLLRCDRDDDTGSGNSDTFTNSSDTTPRVYWFRHTGTNITAGHDSITEINNAPQDVGTVTVNKFAVLCRVNAGSPAGYIAAKMSECAVYSTCVSTSDHSSIVSKLVDRWDITT